MTHPSESKVDPKISLAVLCSRPAFAELWQDIIPTDFLVEAPFPPTYPVSQILRTVAKNERATHAVIARNPNIVPSSQLFESIRHIVHDLSERKIEWLLVSGGGLGFNNERYVNGYSQQEPSLRNFNLVAPAIDVFPDLYIVNLQALRKVDLSFVNSSTNTVVELLLIVSGYSAGFLTLYHPELFVTVKSFLTRNYEQFIGSARNYLSKKISDEKINTLLGAITFDRPSNSDLDDSSVESAINLSETARRLVLRYSPMPSFSIVCRTRFSRPHLLRRMLVSLTRAAQIAGSHVECVLATDKEKKAAELELSKLVKDFPDLNFRLAYPDDVGIPSRAANLVSGIRASTREYVWIMDDDDYFSLSAFEEVRPAFFMNHRPIIFCSSDVFFEHWDTHSEGSAVKTGTTYRKTYRAVDWVRAFGGVNPLPICGCIVPRNFLQARLETFNFKHDLSEDYILFLLLLTGENLPEIYLVNSPICNISLREGDENVVTMSDRRPWLRDIGAFLQDLQDKPGVASHGRWRVLVELSALAGAGISQLDRLERDAARHTSINKSKDIEIERLQAELAGLRSIITSLRISGESSTK